MAQTTSEPDSGYQRVTSAAELLRRYAAGERDFHDANLRGANLSYANLSDANLRGANLSYANLSYANLSDANLRGANLSYANLRGANLSYANLRGANLSDADLSDADLSYANLRDADLSYANLSDANLRDANLSYAKNLPVSSHDAIAEVLRQAAGLRYDRLQVAGLPLVTRDWCWTEYQRIALDHWPLEVRRWIVATLTAAGEQFAEQFVETPFLTPEEMAEETPAAERSGDDGQQP